MMRLVATLLFLTLPLFVNAETLYLIAGKLIDVENERVVEQPLIIIEDQRIAQVTQLHVATIPSDANVIDLGNMTILPGLMDMHTHLTSAAELHGYRRLSRSSARSAIYGVTAAKQTLLAGITTVRNVGAADYIDIALRDAINDGEILGPRIFASGPSLGITGGHCDNNLLPPDYQAKSDGVADGPWAVRTKVRENIKYGADVIKFCATGGVLSKGTNVGAQQYSFEEMQALVDEAHLHGRIVAAHAHGTDGIKTAIKAGVDSIEHASFLDDEAIRMAKKNGTVFSMDIYVTEYILSAGEESGILPESLAKERSVGTRQRESFRRAVEAGVTMVMGTDAGVYPHGDNVKQLSRMVEFGMTPMQAIQAATINSAKLLKQQDNIGSISVGRFADIVGVEGDPLQDISLLESASFVMKDGRVIKQN